MAKTVQVSPDDRYNRQLVSHVHPSEWENPEPRGRYNLVVIGAGTGGLVTAAGAAGLGARVALIERNLMGGDCLNVGCVPSKALIRSARAMQESAESPHFGIQRNGQIRADFKKVMERLRRLRSEISQHDSASRFSELGVDVFLGEGRFRDRSSIEVEGQTLEFRKAVIATGGRPVEPPIEGLREAGYLTNETVFSLTELPARLVVVGGGPIGSELAQAFARLGSQVTLVEAQSHFLPREDEDAASLLQEQMKKDGVDLRLGSTVSKVSVRKGQKQIQLSHENSVHVVEADEILVGVGRVPNVENMGLEAAGVRYDLKKGVETNDRLQTTNPKIFAVGDVTLREKFTHTADAAARIVIQNALFFGRKKVSDLVLPWCTYTSPEIGHVGLYEDEARAQGIEVETFRIDFESVDRAVLDGQAEGFVKIHVKKGSDRILGATVVAQHAGDMLSEITLAMVERVGLGSIAKVIHPYPTQAEAIRKAADAYNRTRLTPLIKKLFNLWLTWAR